MAKRWRNQLANPLWLHRVSKLAMMCCGGIAMLAFWWRTTPAQHATYLLDSLALLVGVGATLLDARYADIMSEMQPGRLKRGSLFRLLTGASSMLAGCVVASATWSNHLAAAVAYGVLFAGGAVGLSGLARLLVVDGGAWAADKIQERLDDNY